jgi:hypothetical protein
MEAIDTHNGAPVAITPDSKVVPKRNGSRGMLPSTWTGRTLRVQYVGAAGTLQETSGAFLDWCGAGVVFNIHGAKTLLCWERLVLAELVED